MGKNKPVTFNPDGNDLRRVFDYYNIVQEEKIICPFHDDNNPSCHVDFAVGMFHCFACSVTGDAFQFIQLANPKLSDLDQLILYHAILNTSSSSKIKLTKLNDSKSRKEKEQDNEHELEMSYDYYHGLRTIDWRTIDSEHKDYMLKRGFTAEALNLCQAKLTYANNNYPLIFPVFDMDDFRGYVCRAVDKKVEKQRKYLYNKGFSRRNTVVGRYDNEVVVVCEGYMDALKLRQFGLKYVAAIFGWKITSEQVMKMRANGVKTVISALDLDGPGREGTAYLSNFFDVVNFAYPPGVEDPGDLDEEQFTVAYNKTKRRYRSRRKNNVNSK